MSPATIHILVEPEPPASVPHAVPTVPFRQFRQLDRLADELRTATGAPVLVEERALDGAPGRGPLIVAYRLGMHDRLVAFAKRDRGPDPLILLGVEHDDLAALRDEVRPDAIITSERLARWTLGHEDRPGRQIYGPSTLAPRLAPMLEPTGLLASPGYSMYRSREPIPLAALLARYIDEWRIAGAARAAEE